MPSQISLGFPASLVGRFWLRVCGLSLLLIHVRRKYESVSTVRWEISRSTAIFNPKVRAQTSAMLFVAYPIFFANAHISSPLWLRITPLIPVGPGLCLDAPSMFNLNHPCGGGSHCRCIVIFYFISFLVGSMYESFCSQMCWVFMGLFLNRYSCFLLSILARIWLRSCCMLWVVLRILECFLWSLLFGY